MAFLICPFSTLANQPGPVKWLESSPVYLMKLLTSSCHTFGIQCGAWRNNIVRGHKDTSALTNSAAIHFQPNQYQASSTLCIVLPYLTTPMCWGSILLCHTIWKPCRHEVMKFWSSLMNIEMNIKFNEHLMLWILI